MSLNPVSLLRAFAAAAMRRRAATLLLICVVAFALRAIVIVETRGGSPVDEQDMQSYHNFATAILDGGEWLGNHVSYREPGYPVFLAGVYALSGNSALIARLTNALLGALTCVAIYFLGKRSFGAGVGLVAAAWFAPYFQSIFFATMVLRESLVALMVVMLLLLLVRAVRSGRGVDAVWVALLYLALVHTDARFLFHAPFVLVAYIAGRGGFRVAVKGAAVMALVFVVGMIPWQFRNYTVYDHVVLVNTRTLVMPVPWKDYDAIGPVEGLEKPPPDTRPGVRRLGPARDAVYDFTELYRIFRFRGEVRANSNQWEKPWSVLHNASSVLMYGTLVPFMFVGLWGMARRRMGELYVFGLPVLAHTILHIIKWARPRYRVPIEPILILVGVFGLALAWRWWSKRRATGSGHA